MESAVMMEPDTHMYAFVIMDTVVMNFSKKKKKSAKIWTLVANLVLKHCGREFKSLALYFIKIWITMKNWNFRWRISMLVWPGRKSNWSFSNSAVLYWNLFLSSRLGISQWCLCQTGRYARKRRWSSWLYV